MGFHDFPDPPVVLSMRIPKGFRYFSNRVRGGAVSLAVSAVLNEVRNIQKLEVGTRPSGREDSFGTVIYDPYIDVTVRPNEKYTVAQATAALDKISERCDGLNPRVLAQEWEETPECKRARLVIKSKPAEAAL